MRQALASFGIVRAIGLLLLLVIAIAYSSWATVQAHNTRTELHRITRIVEGTPGPQGEAGIGIRHAICLPGGRCKATLHGQTLTLRIVPPRGPQGERGPAGGEGRTPSARQVAVLVARYCASHNLCRGLPGPPGVVTTKQIRAAVDAFMHSHVFTCKLKSGVLTCRVQ